MDLNCNSKLRPRKEKKELEKNFRNLKEFQSGNKLCKLLINRNKSKNYPKHMINQTMNRLLDFKKRSKADSKNSFNEI